MISTYLKDLSLRLNSTPEDNLVEGWGSNCISSQFLMDNLQKTVKKQGRLFRKKKLSFDPSLTLYIYAYPSYKLFELAKDEPMLRECRGLILSPLGVRSRPFPLIPTIKWKDAIKKIDHMDTTIKINGTMVTGLVLKERVVCITKVGKEIELPATFDTNVKELIYDTDILGLTPVFELTNEDKPLVLRERTNCYLIGLRSCRTGRMSSSTDLIKVAEAYGLGPITSISSGDQISSNMEGIVLCDGEIIMRAKTASFNALQRVTSILRYDRKGDLGEFISKVDKDLLYENLTTSELEELKRRRLL